MGRIVYCRGSYCPEEEAGISLFDRGFLFGDSVYEVSAVINGKMIDNDLHLARLARSLKELGIPLPMPLDEVAAMQQQLIERNTLVEGTIYLQVSRGSADRDFLFPEDLAPSLIAFTQARVLRGTKAQAEGISVGLSDDPRWVRRDIKTTMLLGQVLAKRDAKAAGFGDVWLVQDGLVTEGASSTAFIVTKDQKVITRGNSTVTLPGCTRQALLTLCAEAGLTVEERAFTPEEAKAAVEAFLTSASSLVTPVVQIAEATIGDGKPGPLTKRLQELYLAAATD